MKSFYLFSLLNIFVLTAFSTESDLKFGKISESDFEVTSFEGDTSYSAIILCDIGKTFFTYDATKGFRVNYTRHKRIKILKNEGYNYATVSLSLYNNNSGKEAVTNLKGYTYYLENNKIEKVKLKSDSKFSEEKNDNIDIVKFSMPEVKEGCIIEYEYNIVSDFYWSLKEWYFQSDVPTLYSECSTSIPEFYIYKKFMQGYQIYNRNESGTEPGSITLQSKSRTGGGGFAPSQTSFQTENIKYINNTNMWIMENVPAFKPEPYMPTEHDYISKIIFEIDHTDFIRVGGEYKSHTQSWEAITNKMIMDDNFGAQLNRRGVVKDEVEQITSDLTTTEEKMIATYNYVKNNMKWNNKNGYYTTTTLRQAFNDRSGSVADINMLLTLMLNEADIEAHPVLLSTRANGRLNFEYPTLSQMNYVISCATIDGQRFLLDATDENRPYNLLPKRCLNGKGKIISKDMLSEWVELKNEPAFKKGVAAVLSLNESNSLVASVRTSNSNLAGFDERERIISEGEEKYIENYENSFPSWEFEEIKIDNIKDLSSDLKKSFNVSIDDCVEEAGDMLFFAPIFIERWDENPFKNDTREYPIDFVQPIQEIFSITFQVPENYTIDELPESMKLTLPNNDALFHYFINQTGNSVQLVCRLYINKTLYVSTEYKLLQEFFTNVVAKQSEKIILKKI